MLPALLKRLLPVSNGVELTYSGVGATPAETAQFEYTFFGEDGLSKGGIILAHETHTYSNFCLRTFGSVPATSPEGVFWQEISGEVLIDFNVDFTEGEEVYSLKGTLTLLDWLLNEEKRRWIACVRSSGREVVRVQGTWLRRKL